MYSKVLILLFLCRSHIIFSEEIPKSCIHNTCHECITDPLKCVWCSAELNTLTPDKRCKPADSYKDDWCPLKHIQNPKSDVHITSDRDFTSTKDDVVQLKPQIIKIKLRVGEEVEFQFRYKATAHYPVDLYFLLDASESMKIIRDDIFDRSEAIYNTIHNLTHNIYLGLGTFIDKNVIPFNDDPAHKLCYSFKHSLNLTDNLGEFKDKLREITFGTNYDFPEGGFDGLAQVMACKKHIAWRGQTRKVIVFLTDDRYHSAGDGKLAGIFQPYDGRCYLDADGSYYKEKEMDYPSVGMISKLAADEQFSILFVPSKYTSEYNVLGNAIFGAIGCTDESLSLSERLGDFYKNISLNLQLDVNMPSKDKEYFKIKFEPDCTKAMSCKVEIGEEIPIKGTIKLRNYYRQDLNNTQIPIAQKGLEEKLVLDVDVISTCDCEGESTPNSPKCSHAGTRQCGVCNCNEGRTGSTCMCKENHGASDANSSCVEHGVECSGNGFCSCGDCLCNPGYEGPLCQVRNDNCKRINGVLCSGHGRCLDGKCQCNRMWKGEACDCSMASFYCRNTEGIECNNRGHCECGRCKCDELPQWDVRGYRDEDDCNQWPCEDCHERQCRQLINCIACINTSDNCFEECGERISFGNVTEDFNSHRNVCTNVRISFGCYSDFAYTYNEEMRSIELYVLSEPNCIESHYAYGGGLLGALILIGLGSLLAWKLLNDSRDRAEFERYLQHAREEHEELVNECYKPPTTSIKNPMFRKLSFRT